MEIPKYHIMKKRLMLDLILVTMVYLLVGCGQEAQPQLERAGDPFLREREWMVERQLAGRDIVDQKVLGVMRRLPRHLFVPERYREYAYADQPLPIGEGQTISQPYIVAYMTQVLGLEREDRVLEIGTGSGYQAAVLAELVAEVYSIEIVPALGERARGLLEELGYGNVRVRVGDGYLGWPEAAPFDAIIVTAAPDHIPEPLIEQLAEGGVLVVPVGDSNQELVRLSKRAGGNIVESLLAVRFVPLTGPHSRASEVRE
jgi:protein-L-isoaspartate(D-aspartate) O-methyltransferase